MRMNPDNIKKIAASDKATVTMLRNTLNNAARYIESLQLANGELVVAGLEVIRTEPFKQDHPDRVSAHASLRKAVRDSSKRIA